MRMAELSRRSGVPVSSIKLYLREGLLPHGVRTAANQARYDDEHLQRLAMVRSLIEVGGLRVARVRAVLDEDRARAADVEDGFAWASGLVERRWALELVRVLAWGPQRFADLRAALPEISSNVLSQRLKDFTAEGIATRRRLAPPAASTVYELTGWGRRLVPVVVALERWGQEVTGDRAAS